MAGLGKTTTPVTASPRGAYVSGARAMTNAIAAQKSDQLQQHQGAASSVVAAPSAGAAASAKDKQFRVDSDVRTMAVSGHTVWLAHNDGTLSVRKTRTAEIAHHFAAGTGRVWSLLALATGGCDYVWVGLSTGDIEIYNSMSREFVKKLSRHTGGIYCLAEFNGQVFSGSNDFEIMQWDAHEMTFTRQLTGHTNYVRCLHAEGAALFSGSDDHTIRVWNCSNGQHLNTAKFHSTGVSAMCRVGMHMWSGDDSGRIAVWRLQTLEHEATLQEHLGRINTIKKVGSRVYSGSADHEIIVWDAYTRDQVTRINDHRGWVMHLACPAQLSRYYLWSAAADGSVRCWHHDEYRVMNPDLERFDDARWYNAEFTPYKELNCTLTTQVAQLERRCDLLQREFTSKSTLLMEQTNGLHTVQTTIKAWQEEVENSRLIVREAERTTAQLRAALADKEKELLELSQRTRTYQGENVDLRCQNDKLRLEGEELRRRLDLSEKERVKLDSALRETLQTRSDGKSPLPCIIVTETQAQEALVNVQRQLADAIQMNQSLIVDLNRYKAILGIAPTPLPRQIAMGAASPVAGGGTASPTRAQIGAAHLVALEQQQQQQQQQQQLSAASTPLPGTQATATAVPPSTTGAAGAPTSQQQPQGLTRDAAATTDRVVALAEGYSSRGARWTSNVASYVQDRYFSAKPKVPQVPLGRPGSARRLY